MVLTRAVLVALLAIAMAGCPNGGSSTTPNIVSFTCTPASLTSPGGPVTLSWSVSGAVSVSIDQNVGGVSPPNSGSTTVQVTASTTFTLTATGSTGTSATKQCSVTVSPLPTINSFTATPNNLVVGGGPVTLAWNVTGATSLSIDQGVGPVTPVTVGSTVVQVTTTTTFTLTATNATGSRTFTVTVTVAHDAAHHQQLYGRRRTTSGSAAARLPSRGM